MLGTVAGVVVVVEEDELEELEEDELEELEEDELEEVVGVAVAIFEVPLRPMSLRALTM